MLQGFVSRTVSMVLAACGGALVYAGVVDADTWAGVVTPEFAASVSAVIGTVVYGVARMAINAVESLWSVE